MKKRGNQEQPTVVPLKTMLSFVVHRGEGPTIMAAPVVFNPQMVRRVAISNLLARAMPVR